MIAVAKNDLQHRDNIQLHCRVVFSAVKCSSTQAPLLRQFHLLTILRACDQGSLAHAQKVRQDSSSDRDLEKNLNFVSLQEQRQRLVTAHNRPQHAMASAAASK